MAAKKTTWNQIKNSPWTWIIGGGAIILTGWAVVRYYNTRKNLLPGGEEGENGNFIGGTQAVGWLDEKVTGVPSNLDLKSPVKLQQVFNSIKNNFGSEIAKNVERIYRLETDNFKSGQYLRTGSAGMLAFSDSFPYGWNSLSSIWTQYPQHAPIGYARYGKMVNGKYKIYKYLAFPSVAGFAALARILKMRGNNAASWYSTNPQQQAQYAAKLATVNTTYT